VPIIALTANAVTGMREMFLQNGMNDFLSKPIQLSALDNILRKWIPKEKQEKYETAAATETATSPVPIAIAGVDTQAGLAMTGGTAANYLHTLDVFHRDGLDKLYELRACLANSDFALYTTLVHALKSAALSVGAKRLSDSAKTLEIAGKNGSTAFITEHSPAFLADLETLLLNISTALAGVKKETPPDADSAAFLQKSLTELKTALENMEAGATGHILKGLQAGAWDDKQRKAIETLSRLVILFEYDEAISLIDSLLQHLDQA